jgi:hypothetical protein
VSRATTRAGGRQDRISEVAWLWHFITVTRMGWHEQRDGSGAAVEGAAIFGRMIPTAAIREALGDDVDDPQGAAISILERDGRYKDPEPFEPDSASFALLVAATRLICRLKLPTSGTDHLFGPSLRERQER